MLDTDPKTLVKGHFVPSAPRYSYPQRSQGLSQVNCTIVSTRGQEEGTMPPTLPIISRGLGRGVSDVPSQEWAAANLTANTHWKRTVTR